MVEGHPVQDGGLGLLKGDPLKRYWISGQVFTLTCGSKAKIRQTRVHKAAAFSDCGKKEVSMELRHFAFSSGLAKAGQLLEFKFTHLLRPLMVLLGLLAAWPCLHGIQEVLIHRIEREAFEVKPNGIATPAQFGAPFMDTQIAVGDHMLHARSVVSAAANAPALLLFHGNGEALSDWANVQARLWKQGVSSMVFDYSGFGDSSGTPSVDAMHEDARAAYKTFVKVMPASAPRFVMGHSLGNAVMLDALQELSPAPAGMIVHAGFSSARDFAVRTGLASHVVAHLLPDRWNNAQTLSTTNVPVLVMHSDADEVIPLDMGKTLGAAVGTRGEFHLVSKMLHDQIFLLPADQEWHPILGFIKRHGA